MLIAAGHRYPDILGYTLAQTRLFTQAAATLHNQHLAQQLVNQRLAQHADSKQIQTRLNQLLPD